jgi:hypothetical protein
VAIAVAIAVVIACGDSLPEGDGVSAPVRDGSTESDAGPTRCSGAWSAPQKLAGPVNEGNAGSPRISADGRALLFSRRDGDAAPRSTLWLATRADPSADFSDVRKLEIDLASFADAGGDVAFSDPTFATGAGGADTFVYFTAAVLGPRRIYRAKLDVAARTLASPTEVEFPGLEGVQLQQPFIPPHGSEIWMTAYLSPDGSSRATFVRAPLAGGPYTRVEVDRPGGEDMRNPTITPDGKVLLFASHPPPLIQILSATQLPDGRFGEVTPLPLGTSNISETPGSMSEDGCRLYFTRDPERIASIWWSERAPGAL